MKKITFILLAFIGATSFAQEQVTATADVNAEIVSPIEITSSTALNFGTINGTATGGDVTVSNSGNRSFTNTEMNIATASTITAATFSIVAANEYIYSVTIADIDLEGAGANMPVTFTHSRTETESRTGSGSSQELQVGGTLTVGDNQTAGAYSGTVTVQVAYE